MAGSKAKPAVRSRALGAPRPPDGHRPPAAGRVAQPDGGGGGGGGGSDGTEEGSGGVVGWAAAVRDDAVTAGTAVEAVAAVGV